MRQRRTDEGSARRRQGVPGRRPPVTVPWASSEAGGRNARALSGVALGSGRGKGGAYLYRIVSSVVSRLEERKRRVPQSELEARFSPVPRRSFATALLGPRLSLIAEVKRASPSAGPIRTDLEVGPLVWAYEDAGAQAVSVLTEEDHFGGSLEDLRLAVAHTSLPVLRKDFIIDPYQLYEARAYGASAVLLIAALLTDDELRRLAALANELCLDVLLEVHDERELARALEIDDVIIGINNRDLRTFEVSLDTCLRLAPLVPADLMVVAESGIRTHGDVVRLAECGVDGILVGETLLRCPEVGEGVRRLMSPVPTVVPRQQLPRSREDEDE